MDTITEELKNYVIEFVVRQVESDERQQVYIRRYLKANINSILRAIVYRDDRTYEHYGNFSILVHKELKRLRML